MAKYPALQPSSLSRILNVGHFENYLADYINQKKNKKWAKKSDSAVKEKLNEWCEINGKILRKPMDTKKIHKIFDEYIASIGMMTRPEEYGMKVKMASAPRSATVKPKKVAGVNKDSAQESLTAYYVKYLFTNSVSSFKNVDYKKLSEIPMGQPSIEGRVIEYSKIRALGGEFAEGGNWDHSSFKQVNAFKTRITSLSQYEMALDATEIKKKGKDLHNKAAKAGGMANGKQLPLIDRPDKFSTADIFVVSKTRDFKDLMAIDNIYDYVEKLQELYRTKHLIGISLKKVMVKGGALVKEVNVIKQGYTLGRKRIGSHFHQLKKYTNVNSKGNTLGTRFFTTQGFSFDFGQTGGLWFRVPSPQYSMFLSGHTYAGASSRGAQDGSATLGDRSRIIETYMANNPNSAMRNFPSPEKLKQIIEKFEKDGDHVALYGKTLFQMYKGIGGDKITSSADFKEEYHASHELKKKTNASSTTHRDRLSAMICAYFLLQNKKEASLFLRYAYNYLQASHDYGGAPYIKLY